VGSLAAGSVASPGLSVADRSRQARPTSFRQVANGLWVLAGMEPEARRSHLKSQTFCNL
jgi:hypothetical protein